MHCMIFLSPVPDVARMYMLTVSFLTQLDSEYLSSHSKICIQLPSKVGFKTTKYCCMKDMEVHTKLQWHIKLRSKNDNFRTSWSSAKILINILLFICWLQNCQKVSELFRKVLAIRRKHKREPFMMDFIQFGWLIILEGSSRAVCWEETK